MLNQIINKGNFFKKRVKYSITVSMKPHLFSKESCHPPDPDQSAIKNVIELKELLLIVHK